MLRFVKLNLIILLIGLVGFGLLRWLVVSRSPLPENLGVRNGRLAPCPDNQNCVSTRATETQHAIDPIPYNGDTAVAQRRIQAIIARMPRAAVLTANANYIHAEFRTLLWGFIDDVEFQFDEEAGLIHFRSAGRLGYGDMGMNRARMEQIRSAWETAR